jgi:hypothetical protein
LYSRFLWVGMVESEAPEGGRCGRKASATQA